METKRKISRKNIRSMDRARNETQGHGVCWLHGHRLDDGQKPDRVLGLERGQRDRFEEAESQRERHIERQSSQGSSTVLRALLMQDVTC